MMRRRGSTIIEFALTAPLLLLLIAGALNYGLALRVAVSVAEAARAGAQYGSVSSSNAGDSAGIRAAALNAAPNLAGLTVTPAQSCKCANGSSVSCAGSCVSGGVELYVDVTVRGNAPNAFSYPGLAFTGAVQSRAVMRAR